MYDNMRELSESIIKAGIEDGQDLKHAALYGTPLKKMYGGNVERLQKIRKRYDPHRVMDLTGSFKF
jgi:FAD/FMN-containing dehydrogenase